MKTGSSLVRTGLLGLLAVSLQAQPPTPATGAPVSHPAPGQTGTDVFGGWASDDSLDPVAIRPFHPVLPRSNLLGDWDGLQDWLTAHDITSTLTLVTDLAGNPWGGQSQGFTHADNVDLTTDVDLDKLCHDPGASLVVDMTYRGGTSLTDRYIMNAFNVQQVFGGETFHLIDVAYQQRLLRKRLDVRIGRIATGDDFLVSPYDWLFMQNGFDGNPVGIFYNAPGMSAYPSATWGAMAKLRTTGHTYVMVGVYNGDPGIRQNDEHGADFSVHGPAFLIAEAAWRPNSLPTDTGLVGDYKIGAWYDEDRVLDYDTRQFRHGNWGYYFLADQMLHAFGTANTVRGIGVTACVEVAPRQATSEMPYFGTAGLVARGVSARRPRDMIGFGLVHGEFSRSMAAHEAQQALFMPAVGVQKNENAWEATYRAYLPSTAIFLQPDCQYIERPAGTGRIPNAVVLGGQIGINF